MRTTEVSLSSWTLAAGQPARKPSRPLELRHHDFDHKFDSRSVVFDCFWEAPCSVVLVGPPLLNLAGELDIRFVARPSGLACAHRYRELKNLAITRVTVPDGTAALDLETAVGRIPLVPQANLGDLLEGRRAIVTMNRDNPLVRIADWATFYARRHGCDAVVLYDNGSRTYGLAELAEAMAKVEGIRELLLVSWPFPYGPVDGRTRLSYGIWDCLYCQAAALEHARRRLLSRARGVLNVDIDELVLVDGPGTAFDLTERSHTGYLEFSGLWVRGELRNGHAGSSIRRHRDFASIDVDRAGVCEPKWSVDPRRCPDHCQWHVHGILGPIVKDAESHRLELRHFQAFSAGWSEVPNETAEPSATATTPTGETDARLAAELDAVFSATPPRVPKERATADPPSIDRPQADPQAERTTAWALIQRGRWSLDRGDHGRARQAFQKALAAEPSLAPAYYWLSDLELNQGRACEALRIAMAGSAQFPADSIMHLQMSRAYFSRGAASEALAQARQAASFSPDSAVVLSELSAACRLCGDLVLAEAHQRRAIAQQEYREENDPVADWAASGLGDLVPSSVRRAYAPSLYQQLAEILLQAGDVGGAGLAIQRAIERDPSAAEFCETRARIADAAGDAELSTRMRERALQLASAGLDDAVNHPFGPRYRDYLRLKRRERQVWLLWRLGLKDDALTAARRIADQFRQSQAFVILATVQSSMGRIDEAIETTRAGLAETPDDLALVELLERCLASRGNVVANAELASTSTTEEVAPGSRLRLSRNESRTVVGDEYSHIDCSATVSVDGREYRGVRFRYAVYRGSKLLSFHPQECADLVDFRGFDVQRGEWGDYLLIEVLESEEMMRWPSRRSTDSSASDGVGFDRLLEVFRQEWPFMYRWMEDRLAEATRKLDGSA